MSGGTQGGGGRFWASPTILLCSVPASQQAAGRAGAVTLGGRVPEPAAGQSTRRHEHHDVQQVPGEAQVGVGVGGVPKAIPGSRGEGVCERFTPDRRFELERDPLSARYCGECGGLHPAEEGDFWAESSLLGLKITYLAMMEGKIYDITGGCCPPRAVGAPGCSPASSPRLSAEWAGCQRVGIAPDTHRVPYHISCGSRGAARHRSVQGGALGTRGCSWLSQTPKPPVPLRNTPKSGPPSAADLRDFFTRVFQGGPGAAGGGGPFPPPPPAPPGPPPRAEDTGPKGEAKHKRRKKVRRPFQR